MTLSGLLIFAAAYVVAAASPGPGVAALMARVLAKGTQGMPGFIAGFVVGDLIWFSIAATVSLSLDDAIPFQPFSGTCLFPDHETVSWIIGLLC